MKNKRPFLPINVDPMPGRDLKPSYMDQRMHVVSDDFHKGHLYSRLGEKTRVELPY